MANRNVLSVNADSKTVKGTPLGYLTGILYFAPNIISGFQVCAMASAGCILGCLYKAGRGVFNNVQKARIAKTVRYFENREAFIDDLVWSIASLERKAKREGLTPVIRLNGTSDIMWERSHPDLFERFSHLQWYDYTKIPGRNTPENYHLTFSRSESNQAHVQSEIARGLNVAVVFDTLPETYLGLPVFNADKNDLRFLDPSNGIAGLLAKGPAKKDESGFVVRNQDIERTKLVSNIA